MKAETKLPAVFSLRARPGGPSCLSTGIMAMGYIICSAKESWRVHGDHCLVQSGESESCVAAPQGKAFAVHVKSQ